MHKPQPLRTVYDDLEDAYHGADAVRPNWVQIGGRVRAQTEKAFMVEVTDPRGKALVVGVSHWLPKTHVRHAAHIAVHQTRAVDLEVSPWAVAEMARKTRAPKEHQASGRGTQPSQQAAGEAFVPFEVTILRESEKGVLARFRNVDREEHWLPKQHLHEDSTATEDGDVGTVYLPEWLAKAKGLL